MADYRSNSYSYTDKNLQIQPYNGPYSTSGHSHDFRSYSVSYAPSSYDYSTGVPGPLAVVPPPSKLQKGKSTGGSTSKNWNLSDPEFQRKRRVASYKVYSVEGKVKGSFRKSCRWIKDRYTQVRYGWW